jgi:hypothetical protein
MNEIIRADGGEMNPTTAKVVEIRFVIDGSFKTANLIDEVCDNLDWVFAAVELNPDGFGHTVPDMNVMRTAAWMDSDVMAEVEESLKSGEPR